jgi:hypothetical protein
MDNNRGFTMSNVEHILAVHNTLGEGPVWNADEQALYWVDINNQCKALFVFLINQPPILVYSAVK